MKNLTLQVIFQTWDDLNLEFLLDIREMRRVLLEHG
jgi:hypothetical protein